ncbi:MAG: hypothetical protein FGM16_07115 [Flavobacterium sp.]|nr:hypothetical protein [Flavobacterium sp.]
MKTVLNRVVLVLFIMCINSSSYAYKDYSEDDQQLMGGYIENAASNDNPDAPGGDPGVAPINDYLPILLLGAIGLGFVCSRKRRTV